LIVEVEGEGEEERPRLNARAISFSILSLASRASVRGPVLTLSLSSAADVAPAEVSVLTELGGRDSDPFLWFDG
jgi:hypothetical protein